MTSSSPSMPTTLSPGVVSGSETVTGAIAFTDIVAFTELTADHGDDIALALVERHEQLVENLLDDSGRIVKQLGDGMLLFFSDAHIAVDTLLRLQRDAEAEFVGDIPMWLRSGLHWGSPRVRGDDLIGHDVNVASRVSSLAAPGEIIVTEALLDEIMERRDSFRAIGPVFVKGVAEPLRLWRAGV